MTVHALCSIPFHALDGHAVGLGIGMVEIHTALERKGVHLNLGMAFNEVETSRRCSSIQFGHHDPMTLRTCTPVGPGGLSSATVSPDKSRAV